MCGKNTNVFLESFSCFYFLIFRFDMMSKGQGGLFVGKLIFILSLCISEQSSIILETGPSPIPPQ